MSDFCLGATLGEALNATGLTWTTSATFPASGWVAQSALTHDGVSAAMSGSVFSIGQTSTLQTTVVGPGTLSFWWRNPSTYNTLTFSTNATKVASIVFYPSWQQQVVYLCPGTQTLKWVYAYTSPGDTGQPAGLDEVNYVAGQTAPVLTTQPRSQSQIPGGNTTFTVSAGGSPPLQWQWSRNGQEITGATTTSLTVSNVQQADLGEYRVNVSNSLGATLSSNVTLEFGELTAWGSPALNATMTPPGATNLLALAAGNCFTLALRTDGRLLAWGNDTKSETTQAQTVTDVIAIAANYNALALKADGTVIAWGDASMSGTKVPADLTNAVAIAAGGYHNLALTSDGRVAAWGTSYGTNVPAGLSNVVALAATSSGGLALLADGTVITWGTAPAPPAGLSNVVAIAAGMGHCLALRDDGTVAAWGIDAYGQTTIPTGLSNVVAISAGTFHSVALQADGTVVAWGFNYNGQTAVPAALGSAAAITAGAQHNVALAGTPPAGKGLIVRPQLAGSGFTVTVSSRSGRVYGLEYKSAIEDAAWTRLPLAAGNGADLVLRDPGAGAASRFYRIRRW